MNNIVKDMLVITAAIGIAIIISMLSIIVPMIVMIDTIILK